MFQLSANDFHMVLLKNTSNIFIVLTVAIAMIVNE